MMFKRLSCWAVLATAGLMPVAGMAEAPAIAPAEMAVKAESSLLISLARAGDRLVAVGSRGHILISDDQGVRWTQVPVPVNNLLTSAYFVDEQRGWVVGHDATILVTEDGGSTWAVRHFDASMEPLFDIMFFDEQRGLAIGAYGLVMATSDGGGSWEVIESTLSEEGVHLNAISRLNDGSYLIVGEVGLLAHSTDEGANWTTLESPYESSLFSVAPVGTNGAIVGGLRGNVFTASDVASGEWRELDTGTVQSVFGIADDGAGGFWLAGLNGSLLHADPQLNIKKASTGAINGNGSDEDLIVTAIGGVAYSDVMTLDAQTLLVVGDAGVKRMAFSR